MSYARYLNVSVIKVYELHNNIVLCSIFSSLILKEKSMNRCRNEYLQKSAALNFKF